MGRIRTEALGSWPDITAAVPGLDRIGHVLRERAGLSSILSRIDRLEIELRGDVSYERCVHLSDDLQQVVLALLQAEDEVAPQISGSVPWAAYKWVSHAASWIIGARVARDYASEHSGHDLKQAVDALRSGVQCASEAALAFCRFDATMLEVDSAEAARRDTRRRRANAG